MKMLDKSTTDAMIINMSIRDNTYEDIRDVAKRLDVGCLPYGERIIYDWQYGHLTGFNAKLMDAIATSSGNNTVLLFKGFPEEVLAYVAYTHTSDWWQKVQKAQAKHR